MLCGVQAVPGKLFPQRTFFDQVNEAGKTWKNYYNDTPWELFLESIAHNPEHVAPLTQFYQDAENGELPSYAWINPRAGVVWRVRACWRHIRATCFQVFPPCVDSIHHAAVARCFHPVLIQFVMSGLRCLYTHMCEGMNVTTGQGSNDQHPDHDVALGEALIKDIYESLRASPQWNETLFIVTCVMHYTAVHHCCCCLADLRSHA